VKFEAYTVNDLVYSFCPACRRWSTDPHGTEVVVIGPAPPEVLKDMKRIRPRGPHYHHRNRLGHRFGNAIVVMGEQSIEIDLSTTPYKFSDAAFPQWRALVKRFYGRSVREEPYIVAAVDIPSWDGFFEALGLEIEGWAERETCSMSPA
jgi:hypothetical protein